MNSVASQASSADSATRSATKALLLAILLSPLALRGLPVQAATGGSITLPQLQSGEVNKTGLTLTIDTVWVDSAGYRPVRVSLKSLSGPVKADRVLTLTFHAMQGYTRLDSVAATRTIEIPAGSSAAQATISVPEFCMWGLFAVDVFEDGENVKQLSIPENAGWTSWSGSTKGDGASPVILLISGVDRISNSFLAVNSSMEMMSIAPDDPTAIIDPQIATAGVGSSSAIRWKGGACPRFVNCVAGRIANAVDRLHLFRRTVCLTG